MRWRMSCVIWCRWQIEIDLKIFVDLTKSTGINIGIYENFFIKTGSNASHGTYPMGMCRIQIKS